MVRFIRKSLRVLTLRQPRGISALTFTFATLLAAASVFAGGAATAALHGSPLYDVKVVGNALVASPAPGEKPVAQALKIVESTQCPHRVMSDNRIEIEGACTYLSALYHYVPPTNGDKIQVTGGFSFTRRTATNYALVIAKGMRFYPPQNVPANLPTNLPAEPKVRELPIPEELRR